jgi:hypothetical protein
MSDKKTSVDVFGVQPLAEAVKIATKGAVDGAAAFLGRICLPAAEEFGLLLKDRVSHWRTRNLVSISDKTKEIMEQHGGIEGLQAHPRIMNEIIEKGSWCSEDDVQSMWAGLLASSCTTDGKDESALVFINLLGQITTAQARMLNHACRTANKKLTLDGLLYAEKISLTPEELADIWQDNDIYRIDRELDHLRALELITGGFPLHDEEFVEHLRSMEKSRRDRERVTKGLEEMAQRLKEKSCQLGQPEAEEEELEETIEIELPPFKAELKPTAIAIHLYVRCQGCRTSPAEYLGLRTESKENEGIPITASTTTNEPAAGGSI